MADRHFLRKMVHLMMPISLQNLMLASVAAADAVMLGRVSQEQMAAVSLASQVQFVQNMVLAAAVGALTILGAQYWGKGDTVSLKDIFNTGLRMAGAASILTWLLCELSPGLLMRFFTNEPVLIEIGTGYLRVAGWSYLLTGISQCYLAMMKVTDHANRCAWISSGAVILNIVLNAVFIYGLLGAPAMNAEGAALATLISRIIELIWAVISSKQKGFIEPGWSRFLKRNRVLSADFLRCALPLLGGALLWGVGFTSYTAILGHMGTDAAAANSVAAVVRDLMCCLCNGMGAAGGILVGNELGAGLLEKGRLYGDRLKKLSFFLGILCTAVILLLTPLVLHFIILSDQAQVYLKGMMVIMAFYMIGRTVNTVIINGVFAAGGDTLFDMYSLAVTMWGIAIPLALAGAFVFHWSVLAVYACTCLDECGKIPWVLLHFRKYKWVRNLTK